MNETPAGLGSFWSDNRLRFRRFTHTNDAIHAKQAQPRRADESTGEKRPGNSRTRIERVANLAQGKFADPLRHKPIAEVAIRGEIASGRACNARVTRQIHSVGNDGCGSIRHSRTVRENRHSVGDAQRETPTAPTTGRNTPYRLG